MPKACCRRFPVSCQWLAAGSFQSLADALPQEVSSLLPLACFRILPATCTSTERRPRRSSVFLGSDPLLVPRRGQTRGDGPALCPRSVFQLWRFAPSLVHTALLAVPLRASGVRPIPLYGLQGRARGRKSFAFPQLVQPLRPASPPCSWRPSHRV